MIDETNFTSLNFDTSSYIKYPENGITYYAARTYKSSASAWRYPFQSKTITTTSAMVDPYIDDVFYFEVNTTNVAVPSGHWVGYFPNGVKMYDGDYDNGKLFGSWEWNYPNGTPRIRVDYSKNSWQHFDTSGIVKSNLNKEYLTPFISSCWYISEKKFGARSVMMNDNHNNSSYLFCFRYDGKLNISSMPGVSQYIQSDYELLVDVLTLKFPDFKTGKWKKVSYKIKSVKEDKILLKRIKKW